MVDLGLRSGLTAIGIADAGVFEETLAVLHARKRRGLHADMQFTYRNPERSTDPRRILPDARSLVVGAWSYRHQDPQPVPLPSVRTDLSVVSAPNGLVDPADPSDPEPTLIPHASRPVGRVARYASKDHYALLRLALNTIADHLSGLGWQAKVVCDDNALVDRAAAHRAGLGWFGKNSLLLLPELGSWFVLGTVVTDAPLQPTAPVEPYAHGQQCGSCSRCLSACPTGALVEPGVVDARRCLAWLVQAPGSFPEQYRRALGNRIYGCDDCQQVCPINRIADRRDPPPPESADDRPWIDLLDLLESTDDELLAAHGRWYIAGRDPRYLRRNALVALGNVGDGRDLATEWALRHWLGVNDPMLVEHAQWAAHQLQRDDLVEQTT
ncbi:MAG: tRNA epoxyqueuosine(34) reductase QueG [Acidimicrobiales bacterium]|nr:tRNA epoxyqueuosine(34) reductase QueG [Acidimicrobiales bacterium]